MFKVQYNRLMAPSRLIDYRSLAAALNAAVVFAVKTDEMQHIFMHDNEIGQVYLLEGKVEVNLSIHANLHVVMTDEEAERLDRDEQKYLPQMPYDQALTTPADWVEAKDSMLRALARFKQG